MTLHIPPDSAARGSWHRVYDVSPMIVTAASSIGSSFDEKEYHKMMRGRSNTRYPNSLNGQYSSDQYDDDDDTDPQFDRYGGS